MGVLRSEKMKHGTLVVPTERARHFVDLIGRKATVQIEDMNVQDMRRPYKKYITRIDEMERILRFLTEEISNISGTEIKKNQVDSFLENDHMYKLDDVEAELKTLYGRFMEFKVNNSDLYEQMNSAIEERYVMHMAQLSLANMAAQRRGMDLSRSDQDEGFEDGASLTQSLLGHEEGRSAGDLAFSNIAGVILQSDQDRFARTLFRATRGNTFTHFQQIPELLKDPKTGKEVMKSVLVVYYQDYSARTSAIGDKVKKICQSFGVNLYGWPTDSEDAERRRAFITQTVEERKTALNAYEQYMRREAKVLLDVARPEGNSKIEDLRLFCLKEKSIYTTLNYFEGEITLRANCWYPESEEERIRQLLIQQSNGHQTSGMLVADRTNTKKDPPTYIRRNCFTDPFQDLVDTYGVPRYGEANPALLTCVTFPFLFGVMFGDVGHGLMLFCIGLWTVNNSEKLKHTFPELNQARYLLTMMGFFAIFAGFMYNDFFALGLDLFGTRWKAVKTDGGAQYFEPNFDAKNSGSSSGPYPFGLDPAWHGASNELLFVNSLKMKVSVLLGVAHMVAGLLLRFGNAVHEGDTTDFIFECIPMMVFMLCFFGYMDFMILYKWVTPMENPPSIINSLICMVIGSPDKAPLYSVAVRVQTYLLAATALSVPLMLIPKPIILYIQHKNSSSSQPSGQYYALDAFDVVDDEAGKQIQVHGEEFDIGEIVIHQAIETIEYVLGTVSHTASYLRLWALSLAHQQLSVVFFQNTISVGLHMSFPMNGIALYFLFAIWFAITCGILLGIDVLECFLHTLRLHWVEFQSKFYRGDGYTFKPYRHKQLLEDKSDQ
eukprot:gnl/MRDRNA2_/MRDRNA2_78674_c0_seq1.p1 gnl/MRDRNA2_/MRDRNA2_78674_c0~~gnl/MRDRNA2_/MRDRNA2_78674_c0_seq1.p1  ORF type:complete len:831 (-),score=151.11 gnl/MRDRNA2_/MRDRNA2_78674_c0_seq1:32-2524(-)